MVERLEELRKEYKQPEVYQSFVVKTGEERANPNSHDQVKDWLYSIGWNPSTLSLTGAVMAKRTQIPQVRKDGELCSVSQKSLASADPAVVILDGLSVLSHRMSVLKGMVDSERDGYVQATIAGSYQHNALPSCKTFSQSTLSGKALWC